MGEGGKPRSPKLLAFATQGAGGDDEARLRMLLSGFDDVTWFPFERGSKGGSFRKLRRTIAQERPDLIVMEGTGIAGGLALLLGRLRGIPYVFSSGDAIGPFVAAIRPLFGPAFAAYERLLCRCADGFIGWSPYLVGRALTFGCRRGMTAPGWASTSLPEADRAAARSDVRRALAIPQDAVVFGIVGSLAWNRRVGYCYGLELVRAVQRVNRDDVYVMVVGDGSGLSILQSTAEQGRADRCRLTGRIPRLEVPRYLAAFDVASLPQSLDGVGSFRYTTKISEYLDAGLPIVTGRLPLAYDLDDGRLLRLAGKAPWDDRYVASLADLMESYSVESLAGGSANGPRNQLEFNRDRQVARTTAFLSDILADRNSP